MPTEKPKPRSAADLWELLARSRLHDAALVATLQAAFGGSAAARTADAAAVAQWLVSQQQLTGWQARRLLRGDAGPFTIGDYRLLDRIDSPICAMLVRAVHLPSSRPVVIAMLDRDRCRDVETWTAIVRRTAVAHQLTDPMFSKTWALEQIEGNRVIVCEDVAGPPLLAELSKGKGLPVKEAGWIALSVARAAAEHQRVAGVHGAISLDSLRRDPQSGSVRLLQYPLVGDPHASPPRIPLELPATVSQLGTRVAFLPPECILSGGGLDESSDVYAIGCLLSTLLTGSVPGWKGDAAATLAEAAVGGFEPPGPPLVPLEVGTLVGYLTARDPSERYQNAADAAAAIAACFGFPIPANEQPQAVRAGGMPSEAGAVFPADFSTGTQPERAMPVGGDPRLSRGGPAAAPSLVQATGRPPNEATRRARGRAATFRAAMTGLALLALVGVVAYAFLGDGSGSGRQGDGSRVSSKNGKKKPSSGKGSRSGGNGGRQDTGNRDTELDEDDEVEEEFEEEEEEQTNPAMAGGNEGTRDAKGVPATTVSVRRVNDAETIWDAPTHAGPPSLDYLPPGSQVTLVLRPAELLSTEEGGRFLRALGPSAEAAMAEAARLCGCDTRGIVRILAGWQADTKGTAVAAFTFELAEPIDAERPPAAWSSLKRETVGEETVFRGPKLSLAVPKAHGGRLLVAAPHDLLSLMLETGGSPQLTRDMQRLVEKLDARRHVVLFGSPAFLENDGRDMLSGPLARIAEPVARVFGTGVHAAAFSLHFDESSAYAELLAVPPVDLPAPALAESIRKNVVAVPDAVEEYITSVDLHPYGRKLVNRLPQMLRILDANLRRAAEEGIAVVNCHMPAAAPHNLALASEIALEQRPGTSVAAKGGGGQPAAKGAAAALAKTISLSFPRDSLDRTMQTIADEIGVPIEILGGDLQLEGITKNQSFGLDERDKTVDSILRTIFMKANPDGKLVYVIREKDGVESIVITTRAACKTRNEPIPEVFQKP